MTDKTKKADAATENADTQKKQCEKALCKHVNKGLSGGRYVMTKDGTLSALQVADEKRNPELNPEEKS